MITASVALLGKKRGRPPKPVRSNKSQPSLPPSTIAPTTTPAPAPAVATPTATLSQDANEVMRSTVCHHCSHLCLLPIHTLSQAQHALAPPGPSLVRGEEGEGDGEGEGEVVEGSGLFAETRRKVERSFRSRLTQLSSPAEDLGYQYFVEKVFAVLLMCMWYPSMYDVVSVRGWVVSVDVGCVSWHECVPSSLQLMSSIKTVLMEMLSQFEAKGKMGAKVIREQLHTAWPVPSSRTLQEQLRKEMLQQLNHELEVVSVVVWGWGCGYVSVCVGWRCGQELCIAMVPAGTSSC